jgi:hypothetical protein
MKMNNYFAEFLCKRVNVVHQSLCWKTCRLGLNCWWMAVWLFVLKRWLRFRRRRDARPNYKATRQFNLFTVYLHYTRHFTYNYLRELSPTSPNTIRPQLVFNLALLDVYPCVYPRVYPCAIVYKSYVNVCNSVWSCANLPWARGPFYMAQQPKQW